MINQLRFDAINKLLINRLFNLRIAYLPDSKYKAYMEASEPK